MFPIHFKLTIGTVAELQRLTAFLEQDTDLAVANAPKLDKPKAEAPGKPSAAKTAPSPRTAEAAPSPSADPVAQADAPATQTEATPTAAAAASVSYQDLQKAVLALHKMDPQAAVPIAKALGADTFKLLPESKWTEALAQVNAAIEQRKAA